MAKVGISVTDIAAGMYAYSGDARRAAGAAETGRGSSLDVSMLESTVEWMGFPLYYAYQGAPPAPRAGAAHATIYPYGPFTAGDGKTVMMAIQNEREWRAFCATLPLHSGRPPRVRGQRQPQRQPRGARTHHRRPVQGTHR